MLSISTYLNESFYKNVGTEGIVTTKKSFDEIMKDLHHKPTISMQGSRKAALCSLLAGMIKGTVITVKPYAQQNKIKYIKQGDTLWSANNSSSSTNLSVNIPSVSVLYAMSDSIYCCKKEPELDFE